ncbi:MAG: transcriptional regulator [Haliea sp.]|jgi:DNA-binding HxlR family transcriptional regulator|nr:transcriptional regulator [Haliea sp.]
MRWSDIDKQFCSVARALSVVGERWTLLILRDAFLGTRRFEQFQHNLGITRHRLSERLGKLVEQGVLVRVPYSERPLRHEYRLTRKGLALYPVLMSLSRWGDEWMADERGAPLEYVHRRCGKRTHPQLSCSECGETLRPEHVQPRLGHALQILADELALDGETDLSLPAVIARSRDANTMKK